MYSCVYFSLKPSNEREYGSLEIVGFDETSNGRPATLAQYNMTGCILNCDPIALSNFVATDDYTGYRLSCEPDFRDKNGDTSERASTIKRMIRLKSLSRGGKQTCSGINPSGPVIRTNTARKTSVHKDSVAFGISLMSSE
jgi:hypothetical protein